MMGKLKRGVIDLFCQRDRRINSRSFVGEDRRKEKPTRTELQQRLNDEFDAFATVVTHSRNLSGGK